MGQTSTPDGTPEPEGLGLVTATTTGDAPKRRGRPPKARPLDVSERLAPDMLSGAPLAEKSAIYWAGVRTFVEGDPNRPHPPVHALVLGRATFSAVFEPWDDGIQGRNHLPGMMIRLTETEVANLKDLLRRSVVRWKQRDGKHAHGYVVTMVTPEMIEEARVRWSLNPAQLATYRAKAASFRILPGDEPVAKYIYCVKVDEDGVGEHSTWRPSTGIPDSVLDMGIENP